MRAAAVLLALQAAPCRADMYDVLSKELLPPASCRHGCANWRSLKEDGSDVPQVAADRMWASGPPDAQVCAQPSRAVHCCNMYNTSWSGEWPYCTGGQQTAAARCGAAEAECRDEYMDKAVGDSPLCDPGFPASGPGFNGAFCWCKNPGAGDARWGTCALPNTTVMHVNLQLADARTVVVSFATFGDPASTRAPPVVEFGAGALDSRAEGVTHVYSMRATAPADSPPKRYYLHFVVLRRLRELTRYCYRARSGGSDWSDAACFVSGGSGGPTRLAMFGDMGVYAWNAMGSLAADRADFDFIVHMGDHAYNYGDANGQRADGYLQAYEPLLRSVPWVPVVGNHEGFDSFHFFFNETDGEAVGQQQHPMASMLHVGTRLGAAVSSGTPRWFSVDIGLVHIVAIDCMVPWGTDAAAEQLRWLRTDLSSVQRSATPWVVAVSHYPVFCSGCDTGTPSGMVTALEPLFIEFGVDLSAAGHWHYYESLWPTVRGNASAALPQQRSFVDPAAPVYVTAGGGGPPGPDGGAGTHASARAGFELYSTGRLVAHNSTHLTWRQVLNRPGAARIVDEWTLVQHRHGPFPPAHGIPTPPTPSPPPPTPLGNGTLRVVPADVCRHYWNWVCNASGIPGGAAGGGQGPCCLDNASDPFFTWRDQGSGAAADLQLWTVHPAAAYPSYWRHTAGRAGLPQPAQTPDYRLGDYGEAGYFGPRQGSDGVWTVNFTSGLWSYGGGGPRTLVQTAGTPLLQPPEGWVAVFSGPSPRLPRVAPFAVWRARPADGYVAIGDFVTAGDPPPSAAARVVASRCVTQCRPELVWCDAPPPDGNCSKPPEEGRWRFAIYRAAANTAAVDMNLIHASNGRQLTSVPCLLADCSS